MNVEPNSPAARLPPPLDAKAIVSHRLAARRQRTRRLRRRVAAATLSTFAVLWGVLYVQLASGHDPALSANLAAVTVPVSTAGDATEAAQALHARRHRLALKHRAAAARAAAAAVSTGAATTSTAGSSTSIAAPTPASPPASSQTTTTASVAPAPVTTTVATTQATNPAAAAPPSTAAPSPAPAVVTTRQS